MLPILSLLAISLGCVTIKEIPKEPLRGARAASQKLLKEGSKLVAKGDYLQASYKYERALNLDPRNSDVYFNLASLKLQQKAEEEAIAFAKRGLRFCPRNKHQCFRFYVVLSVSHQRLGNKKEANIARLKAKALSPNRPYPKIISN